MLIINNTNLTTRPFNRITAGKMHEKYFKLPCVNAGKRM